MLVHSLTFSCAIDMQRSSVPQQNNENSRKEYTAIFGDCDQDKRIYHDATRAPHQLRNTYGVLCARGPQPASGAAPVSSDRAQRV